MRSPVLFALLSFALPLVLAGSHGLGARRHHEVAKRAEGDVVLHKRFSNARFTFYAAGLGACGKTNSGSDFIVALNTPQYGSGYPGPQCFKTITITANGKTAQATIMDECPGCPYGGLDMSRGLFDFFASESVGVVYGSWSFGGGGGGDSGGNDSPTTTHTTHKSTPTTTRTPPTTTHKKSSTTSHTSSTSKSSSSSSKTHTSHTSTSSTPSTTSESIDYNAGVASGLAVPTGTAADTSGSIIEYFNQAIVNLGGLVVAAAVN